MKIYKNYSCGFTLMEVLVVVAIIALLASVIMSSLNTARSKSRDSRRVADIKQLQLALSLYYNDKDTYPAESTIATDLSPSYISVFPKDPQTNAVYNYTTSSGTYVLGTLLENSGSMPSDDLDSTSISGVACAGLNYCVQP